MANALSTICLIFLTLLVPPLGVLAISGFSMDFLINVLLTILGYLPGHIHAFYLEYVYYYREKMDSLLRAAAPARGVYSERIQYGALAEGGYGTIS